MGLTEESGRIHDNRRRTRMRSLPSQIRSSRCLFTLCLSVRDMASKKDVSAKRAAAGGGGFGFTTTDKVQMPLVHCGHCSPGHNASARTPGAGEGNNWWIKKIVLTVFVYSNNSLVLKFIGVFFSQYSCNYSASFLFYCLTILYFSSNILAIFWGHSFGVLFSNILLVIFFFCLVTPFTL